MRQISSPSCPSEALMRNKFLLILLMKNFEAVVVNAKADLFSKEWLGRNVDRILLSDLSKLKIKANIHVCSKSGEYHKFVTDGPLFKKSLSR